MVLAEAPPGLAGAGAGAYTVVVSLTHGPANKSAALPGFAVWDGAAPRAVLVAPRKGLPTATAAAGRTLALRARVSVVVANLPAGLAPSDLAVTLGAEAVAVTEVRDTVVCAPAAVDCARTRLALLLPAVAAPGAKTLLLSAKALAAPLAVPVEFARTCDLQALSPPPPPPPPPLVLIGHARVPHPVLIGHAVSLTPY